MRTTPIATLLPLLLLMTWGCSSDDASTAGTGGALGTGGDGLGTGGSTLGTGGAANGTGGSASGGSASGGSGNGTGGAPSAAFTCPSGLAGQKPVITGKSTTLVATATGESRFLEGPVWVNGMLLVSQLRSWGDPAPSNILKLEGSSLVEFLPDAMAGTNGLALRGDGKVVAASQRIHGLFAFDPANPTSTPEVIVDKYMDKGFNSPNDLTIRADGTIYFTDPDWNCGSDCPQGKGNNHVYRVKGSTLQMVDPPHDEPNGIALSPDGNTLYVAGDSAGIKKYELAADGTIGMMSDFAAQKGVDGMTVDCAGNLYATVNGDGKLVVYEPNGTVIGEINGLPGATNVAFGGADSKTLYITHQLNLKKLDLEVPGLPY